jgi:putative thioredoxin
MAETSVTTGVQTVISIQDQDFESMVIEQSRTVPVVVDFWAPWCGPCRVLGPILERLAVEMRGAFILAKVNVDQSPELSRRFSVQSIPMVKAFRDGDMVDGFTGALPESQVRTWLRKLIPSRADRLASEAASLLTTDPRSATERFRAALAEEPAHPASLLGLGRLLVLTGDPEGRDLLRQVSASSPAYKEAQALLNLGSFLQTASPTMDDAPKGAGSQVAYASAAEHARNGRWEEALARLLEIVQRDRAFNDDAARRTMLDIFAMLGETDPLVVRYRRLLANALF